MSRNSSILCFSFTASFYPSELSLLIILICFCFNCFSGSLFTPGWGLQIPRCHSALYPQKTLLIEQELPLLSPGDQQCFPTWCFQQQPPGRVGTRDETHLSPLSLPRPRFPNVEPIICGVGFFFFEISFSSHFLNMLTQCLTFLPILGYQSLSGVSNFQIKATDSTNWNYGSTAERSWAVNSDRCGFKSLLHYLQIL